MDQNFSQIEIEDQENSTQYSTILENHHKWIPNFLTIWENIDDSLSQEYWVDCLIAILKGKFFQLERHNINFQY
jgi:hypothetical protein